MSYLVKQYNQKTGCTYVYESESYYVPGVGSRSRRHLIGKLDPETGEVVPTGKRGRPRKVPATTPPEDAPQATLPSPAQADAKEIERLKALLLETQQKNIQLEAENKRNRREIKALKARLDRASSTLEGLKSTLQRCIDSFAEEDATTVNEEDQCAEALLLNEDGLQDLPSSSEDPDPSPS